MYNKGEDNKECQTDVKLMPTQLIISDWVYIFFFSCQIVFFVIIFLFIFLETISVLKVLNDGKQGCNIWDELSPRVMWSSLWNVKRWIRKSRKADSALLLPDVHKDPEEY